jgi:hypothetical protein
MNPGQIYTAFKPHDSGVKVLIQVNDEVWYRMDGGNPAEGVGFSVGLKTIGRQVMEPKCYVLDGSNFKLVTFKQNVVLQAQWLGFLPAGEHHD